MLTKYALKPLTSKWLVAFTKNASSDIATKGYLRKRNGYFQATVQVSVCVVCLMMSQLVVHHAMKSKTEHFNK
jgi:hypothetical protein